jgi:hypothetical protein
MSDIKLFRLKGDSPVEPAGKSVALEKSLQNLIEASAEPMDPKTAGRHGQRTSLAAYFRGASGA